MYSRYARGLWAALRYGAAAMVLAGAAQAAGYPDRPITLVVPFPAGGTPDILARILSEPMAARLGQPLIIENRAGAGGNIGAQAVMRAPADGQTLLMCAFGCAVAPSLYQPPPYDIQKDFAPVAMLGTVPSVLVVNPNVPARTVGELIAYAKAHPGALNSASSGIGGSAHLATELFKQRAGVDIAHIPYKGAGQVAADLLGGQVDMYFDNLPASLPSIRAGKLRAPGRGQRDALGLHSRGAHVRRGRPARFPDHALVRHPGAGRHAAGGDREAARGLHRLAGRARGGGPHARAGCAGRARGAAGRIPGRGARALENRHRTQPHPS